MTQSEREALAGAVRPQNGCDAVPAERQGKPWNQRRSAHGIANLGQTQWQARGFVSHRSFRTPEAGLSRLLQKHA